VLDPRTVGDWHEVQLVGVTVGDEDVPLLRNPKFVVVDPHLHRWAGRLLQVADRLEHEVALLGVEHPVVLNDDRRRKAVDDVWLIVVR